MNKLNKNTTQLENVRHSIFTNAAVLEFQAKRLIQSSLTKDDDCTILIIERIKEISSNLNKIVETNCERSEN